MVLAPGRDRLLLGGFLRRGARDVGMARYFGRNGYGGHLFDPSFRADRLAVRCRRQSGCRLRVPARNGLPSLFSAYRLLGNLCFRSFFSSFFPFSSISFFFFFFFFFF